MNPYADMNLQDHARALLDEQQALVHEMLADDWFALSDDDLLEEAA